MSHSSLNVILVSSEISPFAKTGGLGDMVGSLGMALKNLGMQPIFILPKYRWSSQSSKTSHSTEIPTFFIDIPEFFDRPSLYGEGGKDYPDNCARFAAFCQGVLDLLKSKNLSCEIIHGHDWQTALIPLYLKTLHSDDPFFRKIRTVLTVHNFGYQGIFPATDFKFTGLAQVGEPRVRPYLQPSLEFYGRMNLLKGGIVTADAVTTVSPTYAREVMTPEFGFGLEGVIKEREKDFFGILNGIDTNEWNPATDPHLPTRYSAKDLSGKDLCKRALQQEMGLPAKGEVPIFGMVSRLVDQKGIDLVVETFAALKNLDAQWIFLGSGDPRFEEALKGLSRSSPEKVAVKIGFDDALSHRIEAGADFFLMPSRYEPCGYNQMYSMRYGTIPIVREIGGLKDTVRNLVKDPANGTGIVFDRANAEDLKEAILRALDLYKKPKIFTKLRRRAMRQDFSWKRSVAEYVKLYHKILSLP